MCILKVLCSSLLLSSLSLAHQDNENILHDRNHVHDQNHIMDHMDGVYKTPEKKMSDEELQFHYFKLHDYDNNNQLDGIELVKAITHFHQDESQPEVPPPPVMTDSQLVSMLDTILKQEDMDDNGYITYSEFISAQRSGSPPPPSH